MQTLGEVGLGRSGRGGVQNKVHGADYKPRHAARRARDSAAAQSALGPGGVGVGARVYACSVLLGE